MRLVQPPNTTKYEVASSDTIARIALQYNTTPTELSRLNHLSTSLLYPGQTLFVPEKSAENEKETKAEQNISLLANAPNEPFPVIEIPKKNDQSSDKDMSFSPDKHLDDLLNNDRLHTSDDEVSRKYLKLKSKYVTDGQGVVSGVLLITPQTVMFNPCVSDHLVMERGREMYVVRLPLRAISKIILFEDIAAMVVGDMSKQYIPKISFIDYASELNISPKPGMIVCQETGETYALHSNFEKSIMSSEQLKDKYATLALKDLHEDMFLRENKDGDQTSVDQGISSSEQLSSDSTVKDITMVSQTTDLPPLNNECTGCQNFSEFVEDSQLSSTPKHKTLQDADLAPSDAIDYNSDGTTCNANSLGNNFISDTLANLDNDITTLKDSEINDTTQELDDQSNVEIPLLSINKTNDVNIDINHDTEVETSIEDPFPKEVETPEDSVDVSSNNSGSGNSESEEVSNGCLHVDVCGETEEETDDIAATMVENHFDITSETATDIVDDIDNSQDSTYKTEVNSGDSKAGFFECDESKDSGISDVGPQTNESKDFIRGPLTHGSSLSDEARQWLGKRGVHLSLDKKGEAHYKSDTYEDGKTCCDIETQELVTPRPASKVDDPLMYVAIKVHKSYWCPIRAKQNQIMGVPPNRDQKRREHWFAIPRERVDQFYNFLLYWAPEVCGEDSSGFSTPCSSEHENMDDKISRTDVPGMKMRRSWSLYSVSSKSSTRRTLTEGDLDSKSITFSLCEDEIPDLQTESQILTRKQVHLLTRKLPSRTVGHSWELIYSTTIHGISLSTLYRNFNGYDTPVLIVVKDENQKVFGAFMSEIPRVSEGFYGTGESMLFTFTTDTTLKIFNWTGENNFFIKGSKSSMVIGGGEGVFGLWLDEDLYRGRSHSCKTFANETLSSNEDFICCGLEAWGFV